MIEQPHLLPECHADTLLVNMLIKSTAAHQPSINEVFKTLKIFAAKKRKAVGIIDDDKRKDRDPFYKEFTLINANKENYKYLSHTNGIHHLIVTKGKGFERFITYCAEEVNVKHKLLNDFERLKYLAKSPNVHSDPDFKDLLNTLIQRKSPTLIEIRDILMTHANR
jgi:hypothetical protein